MYRLTICISTSGNTLVIAGNSDVVDRVLEKAAEMSEEAQVAWPDPTTPSDTVLVSNLPPNTPDFATEIYFDKFGPIARVKCISPSQALVTFKTHESKKVYHTVHEYVAYECVHIKLC